MVKCKDRDGFGLFPLGSGMSEYCDIATKDSSKLVQLNNWWSLKLNTSIARRRENSHLMEFVCLIIPNY